MDFSFDVKKAAHRFMRLPWLSSNGKRGCYTSVNSKNLIAQANINVYGYLGLMPKNESKIAQTNTNNSDTIKRSKLAKCSVKLSMNVVRMQAPSEPAMRTRQMNHR